MPAGFKYTTCSLLLLITLLFGSLALADDGDKMLPKQQGLGFIQRLLCIFQYRSNPKCLPVVNPLVLNPESQALMTENGVTIGSAPMQYLQGEKGEQGIQGLTGPRGAAGPAGPKGERGEQGEDGDDGDDGDDGEDGTTYTASELGIVLSGTQFSLQLDGSTLSQGSGGLKVSVITTDEISNGTITNSDISDSAAIAWSKVLKTGGKISDLDAPAYSGNAGKYLTVNAGATGLEWASGGSVTADSLNFTDFSNALVVDEDTAVQTDDHSFMVNGAMYIKGDYVVDCDGSTSGEIGTCSSHSENDALISVESGDTLCTDSLTLPTAVRIDTDSDCSNNSGNDGTYIVGTNSTAATTQVTSVWAFDDANSNNTYTDGEDLYIDNLPANFYSSGTLYVNNLSLLQPQYEDMRLSASQLGAGASAPDQVNWISSNLKVRGFDGNATSEQLFFEIQIPHNYKSGTDIYPHVHWGPTDTNSGNVEWFMEYSWTNISSTFPATTTISIIDGADTTAYKHQIAGLPKISGSGKSLSSMIVGRIYRNPADSDDTYASDAGLLELDFHYQVDGLGSRYEYSK